VNELRKDTVTPNKRPPRRSVDGVAANSSAPALDRRRAAHGNRNGIAAGRAQYDEMGRSRYGGFDIRIDRRRNGRVTRCSALCDGVHCSRATRLVALAG